MTINKERVQYARVLVEVNVKHMPDQIQFVNEKGIVVEQKVKYEWKPTQCNSCKGHEEINCRKQKGKEIWVQKKTQGEGQGMPKASQGRDTQPSSGVQQNLTSVRTGSGHIENQWHC